MGARLYVDSPNREASVYFQSAANYGLDDLAESILFIGGETAVNPVEINRDGEYFLLGHPAIRIVFITTFYDMNNNTSISSQEKTMLLGMIINNTTYSARYDAPLEKFNDHLANAQTIIDSVSIHY